MRRKPSVATNSMARRLTRGTHWVLTAKAVQKPITHPMM